jgi:hypothetical protein
VTVLETIVHSNWAKSPSKDSSIALATGRRGSAGSRTGFKVRFRCHELNQECPVLSAGARVAATVFLRHSFICWLTRHLARFLLPIPS